MGSITDEPLFTRDEILQILQERHLKDLLVSWMRGSVLAREDILLHDLERYVERRLRSVGEGKSVGKNESC